MRPPPATARPRASSAAGMRHASRSRGPTTLLIARISPNGTPRRLAAAATPAPSMPSATASGKRCRSAAADSADTGHRRDGDDRAEPVRHSERPVARSWRDRPGSDRCRSRAPTPARNRRRVSAPRSAKAIEDATAIVPSPTGANPPPMPADRTRSTPSSASAVAAAAAAGPTPATITRAPAARGDDRGALGLDGADHEDVHASSTILTRKFHLLPSGLPLRSSTTWTTNGSPELLLAATR